MKGFANWIMGRSSEEEKNKHLVPMMDVSRPLKKRFSSLLQIVKILSKNQEFSERLEEFYKEHWDTSCYLCFTLLNSPDQIKTKGRGAAWEEISNVLRVLIDVTRYGQLKDYERLQEIATVCLYDENRFEIKELGFEMVLHLLNNNIDMQLPFHLLLAAVDLAQFRNEDQEEAVFPDRSTLVTPSNTNSNPWLQLARESLRKVLPQTVEIKELENIKQLTLPPAVRDAIYFLSKALNFACEDEFAKHPHSRQGHFRKWLDLLRKSLLFLLYPKLNSPNESMSAEWGFHDNLPDILHLLVVKWLCNCIRDNELRDTLFVNWEDYEFVTNVLGATFKLSFEYSMVRKSAAELCIDLYADWIAGNYMPTMMSAKAQEHNKIILSHAIPLFDFSKGKKTKTKCDLCKQLIMILENHREDTNDWQTFLACCHKLAKKLAKTYKISDPQEKQPNLLEKMSEFVMKTLIAASSKIQVDWGSFSKILKIWAKVSESIVEKWLQLMKGLTYELKQSKFETSETLDSWLNFMGVLDDPLNFDPQVQLKWTESLQEIVEIIVEPPQSAPDPNKVLSFFFVILSNLVKKGKPNYTQEVALNTLCAIFTNTKCQDLPQRCYLDHLGLLLNLASRKEHLHNCILKAAPELLDFTPLQALIPTFLPLASAQPSAALNFIFRVMPYPNHFCETQLENFGPYYTLKPHIKSILQACVDDPTLSCKALYGLAVMALEESICSPKPIDEVFTNIFLEMTLSPNDEVALTAFHCLQLISSVLSSQESHVISFLLNKVLTKIQPQREKVIKGLLYTIQHWLLSNNYEPCDQSIITNLFAQLSLLQSNSALSQSLQSEIDTIASVLSLLYFNFPFKNQKLSVSQSIINPEDSRGRRLHFALGSCVILTMILEPNKCKFQLRNKFGKYCWEVQDFKVFEPSTRTEAYHKIFELLTESKVQLQSQDPPPLLTDEPLIPRLIDHIQSEYSETFLDVEIDTDDQMLQKIAEVENLQVDQDSFSRVTVNPPPINLGRCFFSNIGLVDRLKPLESGENIERAIGLMDSYHPRETVKIGVLYVAPGQQNEKEILANDSGSYVFQEFLKTLGEVIQINTHLGYIGSLDKDGSAGDHTIYYADWQYEIIYHVVPLMPNDSYDEQQVKKKRHVGNDIVHIVWSDHWRGYRLDTMRTQFSFVIIVIYPLTNRLFKVKVLKKIPIECGPLQNGMVVPWEVLGNLVRQTAINANQQVRLFKHPNFEKQSQFRIKEIQETINRYLVSDCKKHQVYSSMF